VSGAAGVGARPPEPRSSGLDIVFIGGTGRSGTHALAHLLGRHSDLADVPIEARFHCNKRGMPDLLDGRITVAAYLAKLRGFWWHRVRVDGRPRGLYNLMREAEFEAALERFAAAWEDDPVAGCRGLFCDLLGPIATRHVVHGYSDQVIEQDESFYLAMVEPFEVDISAHTPDERLTLKQYRWWSHDDLRHTDVTPAYVPD